MHDGSAPKLLIEKVSGAIGERMLLGLVCVLYIEPALNTGAPKTKPRAGTRIAVDTVYT